MQAWPEKLAVSRVESADRYSRMVTCQMRGAGWRVELTEPWLWLTRGSRKWLWISGVLGNPV